ncbi:ArsR family transcriptional regulator [Acidaminobacter sp. JC074]|uniref:transcriptional regulator n=1 Tax=Acidaminobacter sp. JC074 TaxID=2530199 RepID=UPI001F0D2E55|nr:transcriptional regulator [Acidaminobacter sp. JC074]MCH4886635.1 ArsR family transcriptional regulator [Acidaminobacter sp. JC074]
MELNSIPDIFQSKIRIAIVSCLLTGKKTFREVKELTGATDGNISTHMKKLVAVDIVQVVKDFENNKPRSTYTLTPSGRKEFEIYVRRLEEIINQAK